MKEVILQLPDSAICSTVVLIHGLSPYQLTIANKAFDFQVPNMTTIDFTDARKDGEGE